MGDLNPWYVQNLAILFEIFKGFLGSAGPKSIKYRSLLQTLLAPLTLGKGKLVGISFAAGVFDLDLRSLAIKTFNIEYIPSLNTLYRIELVVEVSNTHFAKSKGYWNCSVPKVDSAKTQSSSGRDSCNGGSAPDEDKARYIPGCDRNAIYSVSRDIAATPGRHNFLDRIQMQSINLHLRWTMQENRTRRILVIEFSIFQAPKQWYPFHYPHSSPDINHHI